MKKLSEISASIKSKKNEKLDSQSFPIQKLLLSKYDIRKNRNTEKMKEDLLRDGQLQPLTVNINTGEDFATIVNGRTRYLGMIVHPKKFPTANVEVYENLTILEQNYLNAQINVSQNPLSPDEKREFIIKHQHELPMEEMAKALGLGMEMFKNYHATTKVSTDVLKSWVATKGYGRGSVKVEELGKSIRAYERKNKDIDKKTLNKTFKKLGKLSENLDLRRDDKRKDFPKMVEQVAILQKNQTLTKKYDVATIIKSAAKQVTNINGSSGDKLPANSSKKYKIIDSLLKDKYEFAILLFAEGLYRDDNGTQVDSETKRVIDAVDEIIAVGNELEKLSEIEDYALSLNKKVIIHVEDVLEACDSILKKDGRKGFVYVNGASLFAQRPQFMNYLKAKYPNSKIGMVFLNMLFGASQVYLHARLRERLTIYGGVDSFDEVITKFKSLVKFSKFRKYADTPQEKFIVYV